MTSGKPAIRCAATSKGTGQRCGKAPIPGGTVCRFHGGGSKKAREAGLRKVRDDKIWAGLVALDFERVRERSIDEAAFSQWAQDARLLPMNWADPRDLREVAREMRAKATDLTNQARQIEAREREAGRRSAEHRQKRAERSEREKNDAEDY